MPVCLDNSVKWALLVFLAWMVSLVLLVSQDDPDVMEQKVKQVHPDHKAFLV
jgi:hypothetical protein